MTNRTSAATLVGTSDQSCWLAEACNILLLTERDYTVDRVLNPNLTSILQDTHQDSLQLMQILVFTATLWRKLQPSRSQDILLQHLLATFWSLLHSIPVQPSK